MSLSTHVETLFQLAAEAPQLGRALGVYGSNQPDFTSDRALIREYINLKLQALGFDAIEFGDPVVLASIDRHSVSSGSLKSISSHQIESPQQGSAVSSSPVQHFTISNVATDMLASIRIAILSLDQYLPPVDLRIQEFISSRFAPAGTPEELAESLKLPSSASCFNFDRYGVAEELCVPFNSNYCLLNGTEAVRTPQGILCNPESDKRSTAGTFHVAEGGAPIPFDKLAVPRETFVRLLASALNPPAASLHLPFTNNLPESRRCGCWCSLYVTPVVIPGVNEKFPQKHMEVRFFAPGSYVSNIAFVESIFGNAGDPCLPENDLFMRPDNNANVTACMIIAPHLRHLRKRDVGLPHESVATERQKRDGMFYRSDAELYNGGKAFKVCYRDYSGMSITLLADTYYGYSKKEIKTQLSFASNLRGLSEEEHSGGCLVFPAYNWGRHFQSNDWRVGLNIELFEEKPPSSARGPAPSLAAQAGLQTRSSMAADAERAVAKPRASYSFAAMRRLLTAEPRSPDPGHAASAASAASAAQPHLKRAPALGLAAAAAAAVATYVPEKGYLVDKAYPDDIFYVPETTNMDLQTRSVTWTHPETGAPVTDRLLAHKHYVLPNGYRVRLIRHPVSGTWMLQGTRGERSINFHKPFTVSGGGKSEISKSVLDSITTGPFFVADFDRMCRVVDEILRYPFHTRFIDPIIVKAESRGVLSRDRSLGSVIKLLTPDADEFTPEYNAWLEGLDTDALSFIFVLKALYSPSWGDWRGWRAHVRVDTVNGRAGNTLVVHGVPLAVTYLRVGSEQDDSGLWTWRNYRLRQDFYPSLKLQLQDDISATTVLPLPEVDALRGAAPRARSYKLVSNVEYRFFQRPDDCVHPGVDKRCEEDFAATRGRTFITNFEKVPRSEVRNLACDVVSLEKFSRPMQDLIKDFAAGAFPGDEYLAVSSRPRVTSVAADGQLVRTNNVRYLQDRPEWAEPVRCERRLAEVCMRLAVDADLAAPLPVPVDIILPGRRLNPKDGGIKPLAVYGPLHYQELPELCLDLIPSLTGKSPSTTGAGSEGALTKGPFNSLLPIIDLNNAVLGLILTRTPLFTTAAGYIGSRYKVDHDISLVMPEVLARMAEAEREPAYLLETKCLERVDDFEHRGVHVPASMLGYRITRKFVNKYFARVFDTVTGLLPDDCLRPELQSVDNFAEGVLNIYESQRRVVGNYFRDGSVEEAIEPLEYLLHIFMEGSYKGLTRDSPAFRQMFTREHVLASAWYRARLERKQQLDVELQRANMEYLQRFLRDGRAVPELERCGVHIHSMRMHAEQRLAYLSSPQYLRDLEGTIGIHVFARQSGTGDCGGGGAAAH